MAPGCRSLNVVTALAMVAAEALRQTEGWPRDPALRSGSVTAGDT
jgi:tRNA(Leu) C34 or U34 (ribose-2'-O)-methylase TrmL